ncbi:MAG: F0F1 ATP synthase subunit delta [Candidatus Omnitrophota bacterium]
MLLAQLIIIQIVTFVALVFFLRKLLYTEANVEVKRLQRLSAENEKKAEELRKQIEQARMEYEIKLKKAEEEARLLKEAAQKEIEKHQAQAIEVAKEEAERILAQARNTKEKMKEEIKNELEQSVISFACTVVRAAFEEKSYKHIHDELLSDIISHLDSIDEHKITDTVSVIEVTSAFTLKPDEQEKIKTAIAEKASRKLDIKEKIDNSLIAGVLIKIGNLIIDGSLANRIEEVRKKMGREDHAGTDS